MKTMASSVQVVPSGLTKNPEILKQVVKQTQKVMDLDTGDENATIEVIQTRFIAPSYSVKEYGGTEEEFEAALLKAAEDLVQPVLKQIDALLYRATQDSYQEGKAKGLSVGNFLTSDIKGKIVQVMRGNQAFVDVSAADCFARWKAGYAAKKPGAVKVLATAQALGDFDDID